MNLHPSEKNNFNFDEKYLFFNQDKYDFDEKKPFFIAPLSSVNHFLLHHCRQ